MPVLGLADVKPPHVAAYIEMLGAAERDGGAGLAKPSVKQHLAALRMLLDWLVVGHVLDSNPAHAVRGPKYSQKKGRTPVLDRDDARALIAAIDAESLTGLRDRALIGIMIYTFGRVGAVLQMKVCDYFSQGRRGWVRLHEKGGKEHEAPCIPKLETYLDEYIAAAGIADDTEGPLFRTTGRSTGTPHRLTQQDAYRLIQRHAKRFFCFIPCGASIAAAVRRSSSRKSHGATAMRMIVSMSLSSTISPANILVAGEWILTRSSNQRRIRQMLSSFRLLLGFDSRLGGICQLWGSAYLTQHPCANSTKLV